jgi:hypothetical protein
MLTEASDFFLCLFHPMEKRMLIIVIRTDLKSQRMHSINNTTLRKER